MSKIKLLVKTSKNINELKRKEIQSIDWSSFPYEEQIEFVDADTYRKLTKEGRRHINSALKKYEDKPVEFWNIVSKYNDVSLANKLWETATLETKGIMLKNHETWLGYFRPSYEHEMGNPLKENDFITSYIFNIGDGFQYEIYGYIFLADPRISLEEFNAPFQCDDKKYQSLLHFIYSSLEYDNDLYKYPVLVHNDMLKAAGYTHICDLSPSFLEDEDACDKGIMFAKKWISIVTNDEKDFITWDEAVNYIRDNPETFKNEEVMDHLEWWWERSIIEGE